MNQSLPLALFGHHEGSAVGAGGHLVGLSISHELLRLGVEAQWPADPIRGAGQVQTCRVRQMLLQVLERFARQRVAAEGLRWLVERNFFAQAVRDVAQVGQQRGPVSE